MSTSAENQLSIVLLKYNLDEIENSFVTHYLPDLNDLEELNKEYTEKRHKSLLEAHAADDELKLLKEEHDRVTITLIEMQREVKNIQDKVMVADEERLKLEQLIEQEELALDKELDEYAANSKKLAEEIRQSADVYDKEKMTLKTEQASKVLSELLTEENRLQNQRVQLDKCIEDLENEIPDNILEIVGKTELEITLKRLDKELENLRNETENLNIY